MKRNLSLGQATIEYAMVVMILVSILFVLLDKFKFPLFTFEKKLQKEFAATYKYGDKDTCGPADPGPCEGAKRHPRIPGAGNGRMFARSNKK